MWIIVVIITNTVKLCSECFVFTVHKNHNTICVQFSDAVQNTMQIRPAQIRNTDYRNTCACTECKGSVTFSSLFFFWNLSWRLRLTRLKDSKTRWMLPASQAVGQFTWHQKLARQQDTIGLQDSKFTLETTHVFTQIGSA